MRRSALLLSLLALVGLASSALAQDDPTVVIPTGTFEEEYELYQRFTKRPALYLRTRGMERFARTLDKRALKLLSARYLSPEDPRDHVPYLIAGICGEHFTSPDTLDDLLKLAQKSRKASDSWLWFQVLRIQAQNQSADPLNKIATGKHDPFIRAAAIEALAARKDGEAILALIPMLLAEDAPKLKGMTRTLIVESCAAALYAAADKRTSAEFFKVAGLVVDQIDAKKQEYRTKITIARYLRRLFDLKELYLSSGPWRKVLKGEEAKARREANPDSDEAKGTRTRILGGIKGVTIPRFFGIDGTGMRIAFVVDLSDSMLIPLTKEEKEQMRTITRPRTGGGENREPGKTGEAKKEKPKKAKKGKKGKGKGKGGADLPWDTIKTRFDAARESVKLSLRGLGKKMSFSVVVFGTDATLLVPGKGMYAASPANIQKAIKALDAIKTGRPTDERKHGTLRGHTNLHGGLLAAFQATGKRPIATNEHVDSSGFAQGADTVFLLSDGAPSWDNFAQEDFREDDMHAGDPETREKKENVPKLHYYGPYAQWEYLVRDVARMNLFRKAEIHCIGIGEAEERLLKMLVELGLGEYRAIGGSSSE